MAREGAEVALASCCLVPFPMGLNGNLPHVGRIDQIDQIDQIDHDLDHLEPNLQLGHVVQGLHSTDPTQESRPR